MKTTEVYVTRYHCLANGKKFNTAGFARNLSQEYGQKYYVTEDGEAAIVDLINAKPEGMQDLDRYVELFWQDSELTKLFDGSSDVRQAAWRFFADLSRNKRLWYFERMKGHPVCGILIMHKIEEIKDQLYTNAHSLGKEKKLLVELQPVNFTKWLSLTDADKRRWMQHFLATPAYYDVNNIDKPLFPHPFHPDLSV